MMILVLLIPVDRKVDLVKALLAAGADPNAAIAKSPPRVGFTLGGFNPAGASAFVVAASAGDAALMRMLVQAGANPALTTRDGTTALMAAAGSGRRAFFDGGANHIRDGGPGRAPRVGRSARASRQCCQC